ncbi:hypothetical protein [Sphingomonas sp. CARO-RG-8B-R24-01]|uniref:hypothetical protein n=1 Tax=Sphingomonas sp. CARO-RG-8B-R24-01 TaxID=2914831 RepID=UPI001F57E136|nr:hypothetical protein [Sphingomonas sp. CARO-RG-8B-R24-01]
MLLAVFVILVVGLGIGLCSFLLKRNKRSRRRRTHYVTIAVRDSDRATDHENDL